MEIIDKTLERFGRDKFGNRFVRGIVPDNQPFTIIEYIGGDGKSSFEYHSFFNLEVEYNMWKAVFEQLD